MKKKTAHKSRNKKSTTMPTAVAAPKPPEIEQRENWYSPEVAEWVVCPNGHGIDRKPKSFIIREEADGPVLGMQIATVQISDRFSEVDAAKIARLMAWAPQLWQHLQAIANCAVEYEHFEEFNETVECLWASAERYPYEYPIVHHEEEEILRKHNQCRGRFIVHANGSRKPDFLP
jgi:hypothetical protein